MPAGVIGIAMNNGYEGTVSVTADSIIQARLAKVSVEDNGVDNIAFGTPVCLNADNTYSPIVATVEAETGDLSFDSDTFAGIAVREVVQANTFDPQSNVGYRNAVPCDVLTRGQCTVKILGGTPAAGGDVYLVFPEAASGETSVNCVGLAAEDFSETGMAILSEALPNVQFTTGIVDSNDIVEVTIKTRNVG